MSRAAQDSRKQSDAGHRGNVVDEVIAGAVQVAERFDGLASQVERMEARTLLKDEQIPFCRAGACCYAHFETLHERENGRLLIDQPLDILRMHIKLSWRKPDEELLKVWPTTLNRGAFKQIIVAGSRAAVETAFH